MLEKIDWDCFAKRVLHCIDTGERELYPGTYEVPVANYVNEERWKREVDVLFKKRPVVLGFSCELAEPNSYRALQRVGVPILLTRGADGKVRGFLNKCRHRGALVTSEPEKCGVAKRFTCPYHAWTYDNLGELVGVPCRSEFGDIPGAYQSLIPIAVEERAGLIWGILTPGQSIDLQHFLGDMLPMIEQSGFEKYHFAGAATISGPNWKIAMDGYIESYHFQALHKNTFAAFLSHDYSIYDDAGPHCRFFFVHPQIAQLRDIPEKNWKAHNLLQLGYYIFPNFVGAHRQDEDPAEQPFLFFQIWPGDAPDRSETYLTVVSPVPKTSDAQKAEINTFVEMITSVITGEDYWVGRGIQKGLSSMQPESFIFGRMERLCQHYQQSIDALVETSERNTVVASE
jgi:nitrite reductase/ring-hydroxylating ferredoxin subunit